MCATRREWARARSDCACLRRAIMPALPLSRAGGATDAATAVGSFARRVGGRVTVVSAADCRGVTS